MSYQDRYVEHRARKARELGADVKVLGYGKLSRRSRRRFEGVSIDRWERTQLLWAIANAPSSCNRGGVWVQWVDSAEQRCRWGEMLVGGVGWAQHAAAIILLWADPECYQHHNDVMGARLADQDGAFAACMAHVRACEIGVASCYICPNLIEGASSTLLNRGWRLTGALAVGYPMYPELEPPPKREAEEVLL